MGGRVYLLLELKLWVILYSGFNSAWSMAVLWHAFLARVMANRRNFDSISSFIKHYGSATVLSVAIGYAHIATYITYLENRETHSPMKSTEVQTLGELRMRGNTN